MSPFIPATIEEIDGPWLSEALGQTVEVSGEPEALSSAGCHVYRLGVSGGPDAPTSVIVKLPITGELRGLIDAIGVYRREVTFYQRIAEQCPLKVPVAHVARIADESTDFVLVLADIQGARTADQLVGISLEEARRVIDELVRFHAWSWEADRLEEVSDAFAPIDSPAGRAMQEQWGQFFAVGWDRAAALVPEVMTPALETFGRHFPSFVPFFIDELATPRTLTHGELRGENLMFDAGGEIYFVDFQNVQQESGPRELAYFLVQSLKTETRRGHDADLVRYYWEGLQAAGIRDYPYERAWRQYRIAAANQLMIAVAAGLRYDDYDERMQRVTVEMMRRGLAAIEDLDALSLLPLIPETVTASGQADAAG